MNKELGHIEQIYRYLENKMTDKERYAFERAMEADPFLRDAVEGYGYVPSSEAKENLLGLKRVIRHGNSALSLRKIWKVAAVIVFLMGVGSVFFLLQLPQFNQGIELAHNQGEPEVVDSVYVRSEDSLMADSDQKILAQNSIRPSVEAEIKTSEKAKVNVPAPALPPKVAEVLYVVDDDVELDDEQVLEMEEESVEETPINILLEEEESSDFESTTFAAKSEKKLRKADEPQAVSTLSRSAAGDGITLSSDLILAIPPGENEIYIKNIVAAVKEKVNASEELIKVAISISSEGKVKDVKWLKGSKGKLFRNLVKEINAAGNWSPEKRNGVLVDCVVEMTFEF